MTTTTMKNRSNRRRPIPTPEAGSPPLTEELIRKQPPVFRAFYPEEPKLVFAHGGVSVDPKAGLNDYGPYGHEPGRVIKLGLVGTGTGIHAFKEFLHCAQGRLSPGLNKRNKPLDPHTFPDFPGCAESRTFRANFVVANASHERVIPLDFFKQALGTLKDQDKIHRVVDLTVKQIEAMAALEDTPDVIVLVLPPEVEEECAAVGVPMSRLKARLTPLERLRKKFEKESVETGQSHLGLEFDDPDRDTPATAYFNIHHALKAHAMKSGRPTQVIWESTLADPNLASIAWNFFTALYYKAGPRATGRRNCAASRRPSATSITTISWPWSPVGSASCASAGARPCAAPWSRWARGTTCSSATVTSPVSAPIPASGFPGRWRLSSITVFLRPKPSARSCSR